MSTSYYSTQIALLGGVLVATFYNVSLVMLMWMTFLGMVLLLISVRTKSEGGKRQILLISLLAICMTIGLARMELAKTEFGHSLLQTQVGKSVTLTGEVVRDPEIRTKNVHIYVQVALRAIYFS